MALMEVIFVGPGVLACATRGSGRSEAGHCFHLLFFFFFSFFFFLLFLFLLRLLLFTHSGESPVRENLFPPIFWHNKKIYEKKILGNFYFFTKKSWFSLDFFGTASVRSRSLDQPLVPGVFGYNFLSGDYFWDSLIFSR